MTTRRMLLAGAAALTLTGREARAQQPPLPMVASFSILGDIVRSLGGERIALVTLVPPGGDAHVYAPTPADAKAVAEAKLVVANGLGYEGWMRRLMQSSGSKATLVEAAKGVKTLEDKSGHAHGQAHGARDPHAWQSVGNVKLYAANIRDALTAADPAGAAVYAENARRYLAELEVLEAEIRAAIEKIPAERRKVITSHDAFGYFEQAYGIRFIAPRGVSTESEASARDVAQVIRQVKRERIAAVFIETISDQRLIEQIARETGARVGGTLYSDALSKADGPAATYIRMMRHNIRAISEALSPAS